MCILSFPPLPPSLQPILTLPPSFPPSILQIGHGYLHGLPQKCCRSNGTSVFKAPAPHIADATRAVLENGGGVGGEEGEASRAGKERREVNVVDVDLQQKKEQAHQEQQQQASQPSPPHVVSQEG